MRPSVSGSWAACPNRQAVEDDFADVEALRKVADLSDALEDAFVAVEDGAADVQLLVGPHDG